MSFGTMLFNLVIGPLKMLFELAFSLANRFIGTGWSIVALSLFMNLAALPLYRRADAIQAETRETEARLAPGIAHIKRAFRGDQRFMTLQAYYRQNHYSPAHALRGLLPLALEIPFFIAAYRFLSELSKLNGAAFGPIRDLGAPDALISLGSLTVNVLPLLMTGINLLSGAVYNRGTNLKSRLQAWGLAAVFLILLYRSPAGLTLYWTLNNLFSLAKNLWVRFRQTRGGRKPRTRRTPAFLDRKPNPGLFFTAAAVAALLTGGLIPSAVIAASPSEFVDAESVLHPFWYLANSMLLASGTFVLWGGVYYLLGSGRMKKGMELGAWVLAGTMILNYMGFHRSFGILSSALQYETVPMFTAREKGLNLLAMAAAGGVMGFAFAKRENLVRSLCLTGALAVAVMTGVNAVQAAPVIRTAMAAAGSGAGDSPRIPLSREGKNVVVLMMDRAISAYVPCVFAEKPETAEKFDGFVYYPNTLSHGGYTNFGTPGLFGGYEYTPWEMNRRTDLTLPEKHDEALRVLPALFGGEGAEVTVIDPPYAGSYAFVQDLSIYDGMDHVKAYRAKGAFSYNGSAGGKQRLRFRNFFCYALCETAPRIIYGTLYNVGFYNETDAILDRQIRSGISKASGSDAEFLANYDVMTHLGEMTEIREGTGNTLLLMDNNMTHVPELLQAPDYVPAYNVDNTAYDAEHAERFLAGAEPLTVDGEDPMIHYHVNAAALIRIGEWLDYLRENGVYDNTRIIVVSDHGRDLGILKSAVLKDGPDLLLYNALLMVKDFDSRGAVRTDGTFMTNADVPALAAEGLIDNPANPFTGKKLAGGREAKESQKVTVSEDWDTVRNRGTAFSKAGWYEVSEETLNPEKWTYLGEY